MGNQELMDEMKNKLHLTAAYFSSRILCTNHNKYRLYTFSHKSVKSVQIKKLYNDQNTTSSMSPNKQQHYIK